MKKLFAKIMAWFAKQKQPALAPAPTPAPIPVDPPPQAIADDAVFTRAEIGGCKWVAVPTVRLEWAKLGRDKITWSPRAGLWEQGSGLAGDITCIGWVVDGVLHGGKFDWDVKMNGQKDLGNIVYRDEAEPGMGIPSGAMVFFWKQSNSTKKGAGFRTQLVDIGTWP